MHSMFRDYAADLYPAFAGTRASATAGGAGDNTAAPGASIDLTALPDRFESVVFGISARSVLAQTKTLAVTAKIETSSDNTNWSDMLASATVITLTGGTGGSTEVGAAVIGASLEYALRYVRVSTTPDLSATGTDTATVDVFAMFGGRRRQT